MAETNSEYEPILQQHTKYLEDEKYDLVSTSFKTTIKLNTTFQSQFIRHNNNKLKLIMEKIDEIRIDPNVLNRHYILDIIASILYISSLIIDILCLISLSHSYPPFFYAILSFMIIGVSTNVIFSFFWSDVVIEQHFNSKSKLFQFLIITLNIFISGIIGPILSPVWFRNIQNYNDPRRMTWCWIYFLITALPQSYILMIIVLISDDNIYFILSLIFKILSTIFALWCMLEPELWPVIPIPSINEMGNSFIWYLSAAIIDYFTIFFIIIYSFYDTTTFVIKLYFYNALIGEIGVVLLAVHISLNYHKFYLETFHKDDRSTISKILFKSVLYVMFGGTIIICCIVAELICILVINIIYNEVKVNFVDNGMDWNVLRWIVHNTIIHDNYCNIFNCFDYKDKIKRLCVVNGLIYDLYKLESSDKSNKYNPCESAQSLQQYLLSNCKNNFKDVSLKQLKKYMNDPPNIKKIAHSEWFGDDEESTSDVNEYITILRLGCIGLYVVTRINRYIFFPIIVILYFSIFHQYNIAVLIAFIIQSLLIVIALIIIIKICHEIYYAFYFIPSGEIKESLKERIGYYYNTMSIDELHDILISYFPTEVSEMIVSFAMNVSLQQLIDDEKGIIDEALENIKGNNNGVSKRDFNYLLDILPKTYRQRYHKISMRFEDFVEDDGVIDCTECRQFLYEMAEIEAKDMEFNN